MADIKPRWAVLGNDGVRVGSVREVGQNYLLVTTGSRPKEVYIPASAIANVENQNVHLSVAQRDVAGMGWGDRPRDGDAPTSTQEEDLHRHI